MLLLSSAIFFKINIFNKFFQKLHQRVKWFGSRSGPMSWSKLTLISADDISLIINVQVNHQQMIGMNCQVLFSSKMKQEISKIVFCHRCEGCYKISKFFFFSFFSIFNPCGEPRFIFFENTIDPDQLGSDEDI